FPATHRQSLGMLGMHGTYEDNMTMHNADVIFAVGVRFDDRTTTNLAKYCPNATVLHIAIDPRSISTTVNADIPVVGDAR
ncbi:acetolactate synthase 3 large subunit, partial [Salmonella enterica subsp. enterica serovar Infantis]